MNVGNILLVADAIEQARVPGLGFNMANWKATATQWRPDLTGHSCGTVACIAGWTCEVLGTPMITDMSQRNYDRYHEAGDILGLSVADQLELFLPDHPGCSYDSCDDDHQPILPEQAVRCLRNLAITGKVDWEAAMKGDEPVLPPLPVSKSLTRITNPA